MMRFARPEAFLLAVPILLLLKGRIASRGFVGVLRALLLFAALAAVAEPWLPGAATGRDVVFVVDRSLSMPEDADATVREALRACAAAANPGDRAGLVAFGRGAVVETAPIEGFRPVDYVKTVDRDGSDLSKAIDAALSSIPPGRRGSIVVFSDGESTARSPHDAARAAARRDVRIDVFPFRRRGATDVRIEELSLPGDVDVDEPFQWSIWVRSDRATTAPIRLLRDGVVISEATREINPGLNRFVFRDKLSDGGVHRYEAEIDVAEDRVKENNRALGVVRVEGARRILVLTPNGRDDRLTRTLRGAGFDVTTAAPESARLRPEDLDAYRAVVLENVPAARLPSGANAAIRSYVEDFGGGLMMTGGRASFGAGGYRRTEIEKALPVTLEVKQEQRKFSLAMSVALDRSGSMSAPVGRNLTKMDLANNGTIEAIKLLSGADSISVIAVDSAPHVVVPQRPAADVDEIVAKVKRIESMGGGIFVGEALHSAANQISTAPQLNRHIILFADAADAEMPTDYKTFVPKLAASGVTVSVIGLGTEHDSDAALLKEIATLGGGRCFITENPSELPRVFAEETMQVARATFIKEPTPVAIKADLVAMGDFGAVAFPTIGGYSVAYMRQGSSTGAVSADDAKAPIFAFRQAGLGRSAAFMGEVDGEFSGGLATWDGFGAFFNTATRWLAGGDARGDVFAEFVRDGHEAVLAVEVEPGKEALLGAVAAKIAGPDGDPTQVVLTRVGERRLEARIPMDQTGVYRAAIDAGDGRSVRTAPLTLPYSPEYAPSVDPEAGPRLLAEIAEATAGRVDPPYAETFEGPRESAGFTDLAAWFAAAALLLLIAEVAVRRLEIRGPKVPSIGALRRFKPTRRVKVPAPSRKKAGERPVDRAPRGEASAAESPPPKEAAPSPPPPTQKDALSDALAEAKRRARRR